MKKLFRLFWQILLFPLLIVPYSWLNQAVIVKWLGCGCPQIDENGNEIINSFNANDFTRLFWLGIAAVVTVISVFSLKRLEKLWQKVLYLAFMLGISVWLAFYFCSIMMWN